ncbi:hypothetical protein YN1_1060 [Nanoarchaeota archaeon]
MNKWDYFYIIGRDVVQFFDIKLNPELRPYLENSNYVGVLLIGEKTYDKIKENLIESFVKRFYNIEIPRYNINYKNEEKDFKQDYSITNKIQRKDIHNEIKNNIESLVKKLYNGEIYSYNLKYANKGINNKQDYSITMEIYGTYPKSKTLKNKKILIEPTQESENINNIALNEYIEYIVEYELGGYDINAISGKLIAKNNNQKTL